MGVEGISERARHDDAEDRDVGLKSPSVPDEYSGQDADRTGFIGGDHHQHLRLVGPETGIAETDDPFDWLFANHNKPGSHPSDEDIWQ